MSESSYYQRHIFFCLNRRDNGEACCADHKAQDELGEALVAFEAAPAPLKLAGVVAAAIRG